MGDKLQLLKLIANVERCECVGVYIPTREKSMNNDPFGNQRETCRQVELNVWFNAAIQSNNKGVSERL